MRFLSETGHQRPDPGFESGEPCDRMILFTRLLVLAADDQQILSVGCGGETNIVIGIERIPIQPVLEFPVFQGEGHRICAVRHLFAVKAGGCMDRRIGRDHSMGRDDTMAIR